MLLQRLRCYPVKSMAGEDLTTAQFGPRGIQGDRWLAVSDDQGHFASGKNTRRFRRRDGVFAFSAVTRNDGVWVSRAGHSVDVLPRCRMIDIAQDHVHPTDHWLKALGQHRGAKLAVFARVTTAGAVSVGDSVRVM